MLEQVEMSDGILSPEMKLIYLYDLCSLMLQSGITAQQT